jgi:aspartyl-tRNA(Asn)/glutamyl-tRNA(Gln) amidotransferase subunit A
MAEQAESSAVPSGGVLPAELVGVEQLAAAVRRRQLSAVEVTQAYLHRVAALDEQLGCFLKLDAAGALAQAAAVDAQVAAGAAAELPLCGVPVGIKDMLCTRGVETTAASRILRGFVPPYDATAVARLRAAGAVILGKLNQDEFAMGSSTESSAVRPCHNPWDGRRVPGGSSGGAAAAVAAELCPLSLGTDTGGSIRQPAALCGVTGLKPTYGRVSRYGVIAFASSLEQVGPLGRSVRDVALALQVIGGPDPHDATCLPQQQPDYLLACERPLRGLRIGLPGEYFGSAVLPQVAARVHEAVAALQRAGAELVAVSLPLTRYAVAAYHLIASAEAASNLARYDGVRYGLRVTPAPAALAPGQSLLDQMYRQTRAAGFGPEVKRRILTGTFVLRAGYYDAYYRRASQVRTLLGRELAQAFARCDVLATPTSPVPAFALGERYGAPLQMHQADVFTVSANLAGLPGLSVPCGFVEPAEAGQRPLPVGLQLLGPPLGEEAVLRAAAGYQRLTDWHTRRPALTAASKVQG